MLADGGGAESVCFNDVRAGFQILGMDLFDDLRLGELEQLEIALEMFRRVRREAPPSVLFLGEFGRCTIVPIAPSRRTMRWRRRAWSG